MAADVSTGVAHDMTSLRTRRPACGIIPRVADDLAQMGDGAQEALLVRADLPNAHVSLRLLRKQHVAAFLKGREISSSDPCRQAESVRSSW